LIPQTKKMRYFFITVNKHYFLEDKTIYSQKYYYLAKMKRMFILVYVFREMASLGPAAEDDVL
jgi:hypothetical protein